MNKEQRKFKKVVKSRRTRALAKKTHPAFVRQMMSWSAQRKLVPSGTTPLIIQEGATGKTHVI